MAISLRDYQLKAIAHMHNGCILCGGVGSGKSRTSLAYYYKEQGGNLYGDNHVYMKDPKDLYIITTAKKRDSLEWDEELVPFLLSRDNSDGPYSNKVVIDSWNNIEKYRKVKDSFFIFDEQRVVGNGAWVNSFLNISKSNQWILLSATPGDTWQDYIPIFIANGFFKNRTEFYKNHVVFDRFAKYPKVNKYLNTGRLIRLRERILVDMDFNRKTVQHHENVIVNYDHFAYKEIGKQRVNPYKTVEIEVLENEEYILKKVPAPIETASELCLTWRHLVNSDISRADAILTIFKKHPKVIIFYNYDYELDILKSLNYGAKVEVAEWNGHKHQPLPDSNTWVYLVQYTAGCEGWNCITTDTIIFYSQNYSYKVMEQATGRIDRLNTPFINLYYYHLKSTSPIDLAIQRALTQKKKFNEGRFVSKL